MPSCVEAAVRIHPASRNTALLMQQYAYQDEVIRSAWLPQTYLNLQGTYQSDVVSLDLGVDIPGLSLPEIPHFQFKSTADLNQMLYDGGRVRARQLLNERQQELSLLEIEQIQYQVRTVVEGTYFGLIKLQSQLPVLDYQAESLATLEKEVTERVSEGMALEADLDLIKASLIQVEMQEEQLECLIQAQIEVMNKLTGMTFDAHTNFIIPEIPGKSEEGYYRPELLRFSAQKSLLAARSEQLANNRKPTLGLFSQLGYGRPGLNFFNENPDAFYIGGIKASWNIYDWQTGKKQRSVLKLQSDMVNNSQDAFMQDLELQTIRLRAEIDQKEKQIGKDKELIALYQRIASNSETQYQGGVILLSEYIQRLNVLKTARQKLELGIIELTELKQKLNTLKNAK